MLFTTLKYAKTFLLVTGLLHGLSGCGGAKDKPDSSHSSSDAFVSSSPTSSSSSSSASPITYTLGDYIIGADISSIPESLDQGAVFIDTDGQTKPFLDLLKGHGFNYIRLRTFVDPLADYGYGSGAGNCSRKSEAYGDKDHVVAFAQQIKAAGFGLLLDFHYSDTWADPSKQVIPESWRHLQSIDALAAQVHAYTTDVLEALRSADALPDMVQVGNEITPGMLIHEPSAQTDCYGNHSTTRFGPNGSASNWSNLATLLHSGIRAVQEADDNIQVMLHIENFGDPQGVIWWVDNALAQGLHFDVLGLSAYEAFQGPIANWRDTAEQLASRYPELKFSIVEYNPQAQLLNDIMRGLPDNRGIGTFFWEPTLSGFWGQSMFNQTGNTYRAKADAFAPFVQMKEDYGRR